MDTLKKFFANYTVTAHSVAGVFTIAVLAFAAVPQFHDLVMKVYDLLPPIVRQIIVTAVALYTWYKNNTSSSATAAK